MRNQTVIPGKSYQLIDEAGLLKRQQGKIVKRDYDNRLESPYGKLGEHLIF